MSEGGRDGGRSSSSHQHSVGGGAVITYAFDQLNFAGPVERCQAGCLVLVE